MHDANIFASLFDVVPVPVQGKAAGLMNMTGWLGGGATAPLAIGYLARSIGLGAAISFAATAYVAAGILLLIAAGWRQQKAEVVR
jgi:sugar phosphate permease